MTVRRDVVAVAVVVAVRSFLGRGTERAGDMPLLRPMAGEELLALIAAAMMSGEDVPAPAGETPAPSSNTVGKVQSSALGMDLGEVVILGSERLRRLSRSLAASSCSRLCLLLSLSRRSA